MKLLHSKDLMFMEEEVLAVVFDFTSKERDRFGQLKQSIQHLPTALISRSQRSSQTTSKMQNFKIKT